MIERLEEELKSFSDKEWETLINDFYVLKEGLEEIASRDPCSAEYVAVLYSFGHFYMKNRISLIKCRNIRESMNRLIS